MEADEAVDPEVAEEAGAEEDSMPQLPRTREQFRNSKENPQLSMIPINSDGFYRVRIVL